VVELRKTGAIGEPWSFAEFLEDNVVLLLCICLIDFYFLSKQINAVARVDKITLIKCLDESNDEVAKIGANVPYFFEGS
jgi:hypothetical protein